MKEQIANYRKALRNQKLSILVSGAICLGMIVLLIHPYRLTYDINSGLLFAAICGYFYYGELKFKLSLIVFFTMGINLAWILYNEKLSETFIAFIGMGIFITALIYCAWIEQKYSAVISLIKRRSKYS